MNEELRQITSQHPRTMLTPVAFFLARSGVLTLAYEGFCSSILNIKKDVADTIGNLPEEHPGSVWPKTSLGALKQNVTLSIEEIEELHALCLGWDRQIRQSAARVRVDKIHLVQYNCRSLERTASVHSFDLDPTQTEESAFLPPWHLQHVDEVLAQFNIENLHSYSKQIQQTGNHEEHYRCEANGTTLVVDIPERDLPFLAGFRRDVDHLLPERYAWFTDSSLHVTIRNL